VFPVLLVIRTESCFQGRCVPDGELRRSSNTSSGLCEPERSLRCAFVLLLHLAIARSPALAPRRLAAQHYWRTGIRYAD
jgi:hypothetical protein